ncbi:NlpC/P60 family protein [Caballeronia sp. LP006]|uniref:NlpC/P60 family protein n=1 Tax=Caballeronia sp. LP006 TaxID=3038552 RepID=UPI00285F79BA|nr:NlpC/P60 family protein [Caballeronia sp. LP006]MDR5831269.1 NlpC/P60 family protein [Caballeronia sp. LP006]
MRRIWLPFLVSVLLAACGSVPQESARKPAASSTAANRTYKPPPGFPTFVDHSVGREEISIQAMALVGVPYRWGGNTPEAGFDCSGLVRYVVDRAASVNLPRTTAEMSGRGESIEPDGVAPGDLIFFNTTGRAHSHVGIYVGKLRFVNAPSTGGTVRLDYLTNPYWAKRFDGIRRVAPPKSGPAPFDAPTYLASPAGSDVPTAAGASAQASANGRLFSTPADSYARESAAGTSNEAYQPPVSALNAGERRSTVTNAARSNADAFEPPPSSLSAAQRQALAAGATASSARSNADVSEPLPSTLTAAQRQALAATGTAQPSTDAFEPPPPSLSAAQGQALAAGATTNTARSSADAFEPPPPALSAAQRQARLAGAIAPSAVAGSANASPDPIQAAADAFEPPPPTSNAARKQARAAQATSDPADPPAHVIRASTGSLTAPRPNQADDPIARFATGSN